MTGTTRVVAVDPAEAGRHPVPDDADELWQESWGLVWYDPATRVGGYHHLSLQPVRGKADIWDYVIFEGEVIARCHRLGLPLPEDPLGDFRLGSLAITDREPLEHIAVTDDHGDTRLDLEYRSYQPPAAFSVDLDGVDIGAAHYESVGTIDATLRRGAGTVDVRGGTAYQDHSWGRRDWGALATHRWIWATFGTSLTISVIGGFAPTGKRTVWGYVHDGDDYKTVADVSFNFLIRDDGFTTESCDATITTADGSVYPVRGRGDTGSPVGVEGWVMTDTFGTFECNGLRGAGIMECSNLARIPAWLESSGGDRR